MLGLIMSAAIIAEQERSYDACQIPFELQVSVQTLADT